LDPPNEHDFDPNEEDSNSEYEATDTEELYDYNTIYQQTDEDGSDKGVNDEPLIDNQEVEDIKTIDQGTDQAAFDYEEDEGEVTAIVT
jgi:hypothetical protein